LRPAWPMTAPTRVWGAQTEFVRGPRENKSRAPVLLASEPGIFAEVISISSTRSAGVSDSAYFIKSIGLRPTFDLFLGARSGLHLFGRVSSGEALIVLWFCRSQSGSPSATDARGDRARGACVGGCGSGVLSSPKLLGGDG
jgi:hypothetical protein